MSWSFGEGSSEHPYYLVKSDVHCHKKNGSPYHTIDFHAAKNAALR